MPERDRKIETETQRKQTTSQTKNQTGKKAKDVSLQIRKIWSQKYAHAQNTFTNLVRDCGQKTGLFQ
jgi:hypothetical protein